MMAIVLVTALAFATALAFNRRITETLPVATFVAALSVYVFALFLPLNISTWICFGISVVVTAVIVVVKAHESTVQGTGISIFIFVVISLIMCILVSGHRVFYYDDLSYWGLYTKNIFSINRLPQLFENCSIDYKDYTPIVQILQYIAMFGRSTFSETVMFQTNVCFIYIMLLPILSMAFKPQDCSLNEVKTEEKTGVTAKLPRIAAVVMYVIFPHILTAQFYYRLGVDLFLALVFGYILFYIFVFEANDRQSGWFRIIAITCALSYLALIKTSGIVLCILALIMLVVNEIGDTKNKSTGGTAKYAAGKIGLAAIFAFGSYYSWQLFLKYSWNNGYLSNRVKDGIMGGSFSFPEYTKEVVINYIRHFFTYPLTRNKIGVTAFILVVFIVLVHILAARKQGPGSVIRLFVSSMIGLVVFCIAHLSMYLFVFDEWEAHGLLEFDRYITQYLGGVFFLYVCILIRNAFSDKWKNTNKVLLCASTVVFAALLPYADMRQYLISSNYEQAFEEEYGELSRNAESEWKESGIADLGLPLDGTARITLVADAWDETTQFLEYTAVPRPFNNLINTPAVDAGDITGFIEDHCEEYVYIARNASAAYPGSWSETVTLNVDNSPLNPGCLYKVEKTSEGKYLIIVR